MKRVALYGGSFNMPHSGHFQTAEYIQEALGTDEIWFLFSHNVYKDPKIYAPLEERIKMAQILQPHYPNLRAHFSDVQYKIDKHIIYEVMTALKEEYPDHQFIWVMGADNFIQLHKWQYHQEFLSSFPVAILDRPTYTDEALNGDTALKFQFLKVSSADNLITNDHGWLFLNNPTINVSSSALRGALSAGQTDFEGPFQDVANYIIEQGLYDTHSLFVSNDNTFANSVSVRTL